MHTAQEDTVTGSCWSWFVFCRQAAWLGCSPRWTLSPDSVIHPPSSCVFRKNRLPPPASAPDFENKPRTHFSSFLPRNHILTFKASQVLLMFPSGINFLVTLCAFCTHRQTGCQMGSSWGFWKKDKATSLQLYDSNSSAPKWINASRIFFL